MVRLAVEELIERLDITIEVLKTHTNVGGVDSLVEAVTLAKTILEHYVKPFSFTSAEALQKHITKHDRP